MIRKILIANRGEIACRIINTAKKMGIKTVAVYSSVDKYALPVHQADEAFFLGTPKLADSYLNQEKIINIAQQSQVDAIHPGYGFLSENSTFAKACEHHQIIFIGPSSTVIETMADKYKSKQLAKMLNIPTLPAFYIHDALSEVSLIQQADRIGFPLLVKSTYGGGGKGMRLVQHKNELLDHIKAVKVEAKLSFGNSDVLIEKWVPEARHIEVQIVRDLHGHALTLLDRDCSIQRRHQKIIEEAPVIHLDRNIRKAMWAASLNLAHNIQYTGVGTVEFLLDANNDFYFMEMNTRLQVEHPITEMITGIDLIEWQIMIANHDILPIQQHDVKETGHAIEARIYAEDPARQFVPSAGKILYLATPKRSKKIRIDTGIAQGDTITPYYDSLLAKLIVWEKDRKAAVSVFKTAISETAIMGVTNNLALLYQISHHVDFQTGNINTQFLNQHPFQYHSDQLFSQALHYAAFATCYKIFHTEKGYTLETERNNTPWLQHDYWRIWGIEQPTILLWHNNRRFVLKVDVIPNKTNTPHEYEFFYENTKTHITGKAIDQNTWMLSINQQTEQRVSIFLFKQKIHLLHHGQHHCFNIYPPKNRNLQHRQINNQILAPLPGIITVIFAKPGQRVKSGERLLILESMKMEHTVQAPYDGLIQRVYCQTQTIVNDETPLFQIVY